MKHSYEFEYKRILLKPLEKEDIEELRILRNSERQWFVTQKEITQEDQGKWYQSYLNKENDIMFKIVKKDNPEKFIGAISLYGINPKIGIAEFGRTVVDKTKAPEKGIGMEATMAICQFGFEVLKLNKIAAEVLKSNERAIEVYKRAGFYIVGEHDGIYDIEMTPDSIRTDNTDKSQSARMSYNDFQRTSQ